MSYIQSKLINLSGNIIGTLPIANGGTGQTAKTAAFDALSPMTNAGDVIYGGASGTGTRLAAGTTSQVFVGGTTPSWGNVPSAALPLVAQSVTGAVLSAGQLLGTNTNDAASSGYVGEVLPAAGSQTFSVGAATTGAYVLLKSVSLTAGDWEGHGLAILNSAATTVFSGNQVALIGPNNASSTGSTDGLDRTDTFCNLSAPGNGASVVALVVFIQLSLSGTTTYYFNAATQYTSTAPSWLGHLRFRRAR